MHFGVGQLSVFIVATNKQGSNFFKWANPGLFFVYFWSFQTKNSIFITNQLLKNVYPVYNAGIWTHDLSNMSRHPLPLDQGTKMHSYGVY